MTAAAPAMHLGAYVPQTPVGFGAYRAFDWAPETRPARSAVELGFRLEERQIAACANNDSLAKLVKQRAAIGRFRAFVPKDVILIGSE